MQQTENPQPSSDQGSFSSLKYALIGAGFFVAVFAALYGIGFLIYELDLPGKVHLSLPPIDAVDVFPPILMILGAIFLVVACVVTVLLWSACEAAGKFVMVLLRPGNTPSDSHAYCIESTRNGMSSNVEEKKEP